MSKDALSPGSPTMTIVTDTGPPSVRASFRVCAIDSILGLSYMMLPVSSSTSPPRAHAAASSATPAAIATARVFLILDNSSPVRVAVDYGHDRRLDQEKPDGPLTAPGIGSTYTHSTTHHFVHSMGAVGACTCVPGGGPGVRGEAAHEGASRRHCLDDRLSLPAAP